MKLTQVFTGIKTNCFIIITVLFFIMRYDVDAQNYHQLFKESVNLRYANPDSAQVNFKQCLSYFEENQDTAEIIDTKLILIELYSGNGNYLQAYDEAWSLLPLVENHSYLEKKIEVNYRISTLYVILYQFKKAHLYLAEAELMVEELKDKQQQSLWRAKLYALNAWLITNEKPDYETSQKLLLKAIEENRKIDQKIGIVYSQMQLAELHLINNYLKEAEYILLNIEKNNIYKPSNSLLFDHLGQLYMKKGNYVLASVYLKKCLLAIDSFKNHLDNKVEVLDSLSSCYHYLGQNDSAYYYSRLASEVSHSLFGNKSLKNKELFEIKNAYQEKLDQQKLILLEQEKEVIRLKLFIYVAILAIIITGLIIRSKIRTRKIKQLKEQQALENKQQQLDLKLKNKELMTSALQLIERDSLLTDIRRNLEAMDFDAKNKVSVTNLISSINSNKAKKWDEFELYFTNINQEFYSILKNRYPSLSATDLKMCALIKLGLSSKYMADIMAIGSDSINTSRSRIRKKMNLTREVNLTEFLSSVN